MKKTSFAKTVVIGLFAALSLGALAQFGSVKFAKVTAYAPHTSWRGHVLTTRVAVAVPFGYHIYNPHFTGTGVPTSIELVNAPKGVKIEGIVSPKGGTLAGKVVFLPKLFIPKWMHGAKTFTYSVRFQQCNDKICLPPKTVDVTVHTVVK